MAGNVKEGSLPSAWEKYYAHEARHARNNHNALPYKKPPRKQKGWFFASQTINTSILHDDLLVNYVIHAPFSSNGEIGTKKSPALPKGTFY